MAFFHQIEAARAKVENLQTDYLRRFGWKETCNTPGSFWMWKRDFAAEDAKALANWEAREPGPLGKPSAPKAYGSITAPTDLAVSMTVRCLDEQPELGTPDDED